MFALGIRYLNGWSMAASDGASKMQVEWPPHPDRIFMAMAAAWFETGEDINEGRMLRWLETLPPPAITASDATMRAAVTSYVPVNDTRVGRAPPRGNMGELRDAGLAILPEHRARQPRRFPVAIPHDPTVYLIWRNVNLSDHRESLESLARKVTYVGHSASFVQAWIEEDYEIDAVWEPTDGLATLRIRVPYAERLEQLVRMGSRSAWIAFHDLKDEIARAEANLRESKQPPRVEWRDFPNAVLLASETETKRHPEFAAAKSGDVTAAARLAQSMVSEAGIAALRSLIEAVSDSHPTLVSAHAYEREGFNAIPAALTEMLSEQLGVPFDTTVVQINVVGHTGADGYGRLSRQAAFGGDIHKGQHYLIVDDFIGQGGTLANLRGWVEKGGGEVVGALALSGKPYSAILKPSEEQIHELRKKHGREFEKWWREHFGHAFDCLTQSEARYLSRSPDADTIRNRLAAAMREGGGRRHAQSPREQRKHIRELKASLQNRFPAGPPAFPRRPTPGRWQGYRRSRENMKEAIPQSVFDPRIVVLGIKGKPLSLLATLKIAKSVRGLLMRKCPEQPPPEWFSGHNAKGKPSARPHMAIAPLPFVGSRHADGRIMGMALILPRDLNPQEAGRCIEPILREMNTGLPRNHRLFDGKWLECGLEHETRERPPLNLSPETWTGRARGSHVWASVTPVVLNRHFDGEDRWQHAAENVKNACEHIGLPRPRELMLHPVSLVEGAPHARDFAQMTRKSDSGPQSHSHAVIIFDEPVRGPILVGAGRFRGYGLCRPMD